MEAFLKGFDEISQRHGGSYRFPDLDLRVQIKESTMKLVVPVYTEFSNPNSAMLRGKLYLVQRKYKGCWVRFSTVWM
ncbi:exocyst complex component EXO70A1-like [Fagus crenata]